MSLPNLFNKLSVNIILFLMEFFYKHEKKVICLFAKNSKILKLLKALKLERYKYYLYFSGGDLSAYKISSNYIGIQSELELRLYIDKILLKSISRISDFFVYDIPYEKHNFIKDTYGNEEGFFKKIQKELNDYNGFCKIISESYNHILKYQDFSYYSDQEYSKFYLDFSEKRKIFNQFASDVLKIDFLKYYSVWNFCPVCSHDIESITIYLNLEKLFDKSIFTESNKFSIEPNSCNQCSKICSGFSFKNINLSHVYYYCFHCKCTMLISNEFWFPV